MNLGKKVFVSLFTICMVSVFFSCHSSKKDVQTVSDEIPVNTDTMKLQFDFATVDTMNILFTESEKQHIVSGDDMEKLGKLLAQSVNDTLLNNSGIMVKITAPEYTLILHHNDKSEAKVSWLMIWKESGRLKLEKKWYLLPAEKKEEVYSLLDKYNK